MDDDWMEVEEAVSRLGLFESDYLPGLSHGVCDACERSINDALDRRAED